jgi:hypothetical protein
LVTVLRAASREAWIGFAQAGAEGQRGHDRPIAGIEPVPVWKGSKRHTSRQPAAFADSGAHRALGCGGGLGFWRPTPSLTAEGA